ncbi:MAG TPA: NADH-ubiquinone oxidoreductase-F iron-sulfur binding region domain-containing protein [Streptosporangiaceae bacterium]|nr:NADH-ubiquinone oxidoreductase-F iron-sulfur binding region domain-containing protein [Streptosporangiaceae bacterium]
MDWGAIDSGGQRSAAGWQRRESRHRQDPAGPRPARPPGQLPRLLPDGFTDEPTHLGEHLARHGPLPAWGGALRWREELIAEVELAGLAGRGGAGFPTAKKLAAVASSGRRAVVVANGTEGEPISAKDKVLLAQAPHLVLDGAVVAAALVGANEAIIVAHSAVSDIVKAAVVERRRARADRIRLRVVPAADQFVAGESSAVVHWIERGIPKPMATRQRLSVSGLNGRPTLVQNVETLAHLALIARHGADWFRAVGTAREPGSMLVTLAGAVRWPGVYEIAIGTPVREVLGRAGGPSVPLSALLIGGYFGSWVDAEAAAALPFSTEGLAPVGGNVGAGLVAALPASACGLVETARVTRYLAGESAGQCGPCVFGLDAVAGQLERLADGRGASLGLLHRWIGQLRSGRGACKHPDGTIGMVRSALEVFSAEIDLHAEGWCTGTTEAGVIPVPAWSQS